MGVGRAVADHAGVFSTTQSTAATSGNSAATSTGLAGGALRSGGSQSLWPGACVVPVELVGFSPGEATMASLPESCSSGLGLAEFVAGVWPPSFTKAVLPLAWVPGAAMPTGSVLPLLPPNGTASVLGELSLMAGVDWAPPPSELGPSPAPFCATSDEPQAPSKPPTRTSKARRSSMLRG